MADSVAPGVVVMAVYRPDPTLLERQIASLRAQSVADWRCLVGIDGADPETRARLLDLIDGDPRFEVREYPENVGVYRHFERLLTTVPPDAAWVALADQDDYWYPDKFERMLPLFADPDVTAVLGQARLVDDAGAVLGFTSRRSGSMSEILLRNQVTGSLVLLRRDVLNVAAPFPAATDTAIHDHWLGVCAAAVGRIALLDSPVQDYVQHSGNVLGEPRQPPVRESWQRVHATGGVRTHAVSVTTHRWGWRVSMARRALAIPDPRGTRSLEALARGTLSPKIIGLVLESLLSRRITARDALGFFVSSALWPFVGTPWRERSDGQEGAGQFLERPWIVVPTFAPDEAVVSRVRALTDQAPVVVVDDGSPDSDRVLRRLHDMPRVTFIRAPVNAGIAAALNVGVRAAHEKAADVILTFDQDSDVSDDHVSRLLSVLASPHDRSIGVVGPGVVGTARITRADPLVGPTVVHSLFQSGMAIPVSTFDRIGLFDEALFIDGVDTDFCLRAQRAGLAVLADPGLCLEHQWGAGPEGVRQFRIGPFRPVATGHSPQRRYYINRNAVLLLRRHGLRCPRWALVSVRHVLMGNLLALSLEPFRRRKLAAAVEGLTDGLRGRSGKADRHP